MCLWFRRKPDIESSFDPRVGNVTITSPISGAYADPVAPPTTITTDGVPTPEPSPHLPQMSSIAEVSQQGQPAAQRDSSKLSPRTSIVPSHLARQTLQQSSQNSPRAHDDQRLSTSTEFSSHHTISGPPSPELSPRWARSPDTAQTYSQTPSKQQSPAHSPGQPPTSLDRRYSSQSGPGHSGNNSPSHMPVHQAYRPADQLTIGAKLSPGLSINSNSTPPVTGGLMTGTGSFSHGYGNSTTASPVDARNPWGTISATTSPIDGKNPWNSKRASQQSASRLLGDSNALKGEKKVMRPPWEKSIPVALVPLSGAVQERTDNMTTTEDLKKDEKTRVTRIHIPMGLPFKLGSAPKRKQQMSPDTASPQTATSTQSVEQWPGTM